MKMIWHDHVCAYDPKISFTPDFKQGLMNGLVSETFSTVVCADGQENNCWLIEKNEDASGQMPSLGESCPSERRERVAPDY